MSNEDGHLGYVCIAYFF